MCERALFDLVMKKEERAVELCVVLCVLPQWVYDVLPGKCCTLPSGSNLSGTPDGYFFLGLVPKAD